MTDKEMNVYKINKQELVRGYQENARSVDQQIKYDIEGVNLYPYNNSYLMVVQTKLWKGT